MSNDGWVKHESVRLPVWKPEAQGNPGEVTTGENGAQYVPGAELEGLVIDRKIISVDGKDKLLLSVKTANSEVAVWCNPVLMRMANEAGVTVDTMVKIRFLGKKKSKSNPSRSYKDFELFTR